MQRSKRWEKRKRQVENDKVEWSEINAKNFLGICQDIRQLCDTGTTNDFRHKCPTDIFGSSKWSENSIYPRNGSGNKNFK